MLHRFQSGIYLKTVLLFAFFLFGCKLRYGYTSHAVMRF